MKNLHFFTDSGEVGSAHISNVPKRNAIYTSLGANATITMLESNTLRGKFRIELSMRLPAAATVSGDDRTREMRELPIETVLTLEKDAKYLKIHTKLKNEIRDHKLTVNFPGPALRAQTLPDVESAWVSPAAPSAGETTRTTRRASSRSSPCRISWTSRTERSAPPS